MTALSIVYVNWKKQLVTLLTLNESICLPVQVTSASVICAHPFSLAQSAIYNLAVRVNHQLCFN